MQLSPDIVCFSHLQWDFVFQRPQHLMTRFARERRVFYVEDLRYGGDSAKLEIKRRSPQLHVVSLYLPGSAIEALQEEKDRIRESLVNQLFAEYGIHEYILWYYAPMAVGFTGQLGPLVTIYDCMDELSAFTGASSWMVERERELFRRADLVFTGGRSLYEAKRSHHPRVYCFPSSVDTDHFRQARTPQSDPVDQQDIGHPRLGFAGVLDERLDVELLAEVATLRPDWQFVIVGPIAKIQADDLPRHRNIHYLGAKPYGELPQYLAGWDVAIMPFARNQATRFISPTKTPEYLAAGKPVVSTSIKDVVDPYGQLRFVHIADTAQDFVNAAERAMREDHAGRLRRVDAHLAQTSWDQTWAEMSRLIQEHLDPELNPARQPGGHVISASSVA